jgi:adenylate kinase family enzyme
VSSIIIISGPVGAGKTTVSRELVADAPGPVAYIRGDVFWSFIAKPVPGRGPRANFKTIMRGLLRTASAFAGDGYEAIVDFPIPPWFLNAARAKMKNAVIDYVVLLPSESVCAARAAARKECAISDYAPYQKLYSAFDDAGEFAVRKDDIDPVTMAAEIRKGLKAGTFRFWE